MSTSTRNQLVPCIILALGIALGGYFIGNTLYKSKVALNIVKVKGLAERRVEADQSNWRISYSVTGEKKSEIPELYQQAEVNKKMILAHLKEGGIEDAEISIGVISYFSEEYRGDDKILVDEKHTLTGMIEVETDRVSVIAPVRASVNTLLIEGIDLVNHAPQYRFTKLNEIKPDMIKEATKNAREAAAEFANNADANVGRIRTATQGGFTIIDVGERHGDTKRLKKDVRVVTTAEFYIE
ncbi:MAG: SIMPL domain-containing protein [Akkermansiaceae bacterium]